MARKPTPIEPEMSLAPCGLALLLVLVGCSETTQAAAPWLGDAVALPSPAAEGSGEPHLSPTEDGAILSWLEPGMEEGVYRFVFSRLEGDGWSTPGTVTSGDQMMVNWADFPSVESIDGTLVAHWLERGGSGAYDYGVRVAHSLDDGRTWSVPWTPHEDVSPTEHGFVSFFPAADGVGLVWLDGREFASGDDGQPPTHEMTLRARTLRPGSEPGPEVVVDPRICDCCQTDAARAASGPVVVYRDRSDEEIRDIYVTRLVDGAWTTGQPVHDDGWRIESCPVNGPAIAARDREVAVAWFTAPGESPLVRVAFSGDSGSEFGPPMRIDDGNPGGRVDVVLLEDGSAVVSWLERLPGRDAEIRARRVSPDGSTSEAAVVATSDSGRASGFPQMIAVPDGKLLFAWTDTEGGPVVRTALAEVPPW